MCTLNINADNKTDLQAAYEILKKLGIQVQPAISYGKLKLINEHEVQCIYCKKVFDPNTISEKELKKSMKSGLCPSCNQVLSYASEIDARQNNRIKNTKNVTNSAGAQCREYILEAMPKFTEQNMIDFCNEEFSKEYFGINYPLFKEVTNLSFDTIKNETRKVRGFNRYNLAIYTILGKDYILCNDMYERHVMIFRNALIKLGFIEGEIIETGKSRTRHVKKTEDENTDKKLFQTMEFNPQNDVIKVRKRKKTKEELLMEIEQQQALDKELRSQNAKKNNIIFGKKHKRVTEQNLIDNFN